MWREWRDIHLCNMFIPEPGRQPRPALCATAWRRLRRERRQDQRADAGGRRQARRRDRSAAAGLRRRERLQDQRADAGGRQQVRRRDRSAAAGLRRQERPRDRHRLLLTAAGGPKACCWLRHQQLQRSWRAGGGRQVSLREGPMWEARLHLGQEEGRRRRRGVRAVGACAREGCPHSPAHSQILDPAQVNCGIVMVEFRYRHTGRI